MNSFLNGISLPLPLSPEEEKTLLTQLNKDNLVQNTLVERNLRLVLHVAKKFQSSELLLEDLFSIGCIGLMKAINTFSYDKSLRLATYASRCIENEILMYLRKNRKHLCVCSFNLPLYSDKKGNYLLLEDTLIDDSEYTIDNYEQKVEDIQNVQNIVNAALNHLSKTKAFIFFSYVGGRNQREIASMIQLSQSYVSRIYKTIIIELEQTYKAQDTFQDGYSFSILNDYNYQLCIYPNCHLAFKESFEDFLSGHPSYLPILIRFEENSKNQYVLILERSLDTFQFIADLLYNT